MQNFPETTAVSQEDFLRYSGNKGYSPSPSQDIIDPNLQMQTFADDTNENITSSHTSRQED